MDAKMMIPLLYIDPSAATYAIQAILGIIVAGGAIISVIWRKTKKKVSKTLKLDETEKKEIEDDIEEF